MSNSKQLLLNAIATDFQKFSRVYNFHFNVEKYAKFKAKSVVDKMLYGKFSEIFSSDSEYVSSIKRQLLQKLHLSQEIDYDINNYLINFALLSYESLSAIIIYIGAIVYSTNITKIISKKELSDLKQYIGEETYNFVLRRAMVLRKRIPNIEVSETRSLCNNIRFAGKKIFAVAMSGMPKSIIDRLNLKFETSFDIAESQDKAQVNQARELIYYIIGTAMPDNQEVQSCLL